MAAKLKVSGFLRFTSGRLINITADLIGVTTASIVLVCDVLTVKRTVFKKLLELIWTLVYVYHY